MLATPVKRSAAETAIRPTVFAAGALRTDWHEQAVTKQKLEVVLREDLNPISRRQKPSPGSGAAVAADVRGILVTASVKQGFPTGLTNISGKHGLPLSRRFGQVFMPRQRGATVTSLSAQGSFSDIQGPADTWAPGAKALQRGSSDQPHNLVEAESPASEKGCRTAATHPPKSQASVLEAEGSQSLLRRASSLTRETFKALKQDTLEVTHPTAILVVGTLQVVDTRLPISL